MATLDAELSVYEALFQRITTDPEMLLLVGDRLHLIMAPEDAHFPYLAHRLEITVLRDVIVPAVYRIDVWDYSPTAERTFAIRRRLVTLLDGEVFTISPDGDSRDIRLAFNGGGLVGTETPGVWRYGMVFLCRFTRAGEVARIHADDV